mmetsp:Transcript_37002/g.82181  ORF Transcript_37002/g.82181 Transcript_37002/m.82181 type:complete len:295 (-) Transcript_37002:199-1083(-)
MAPNLRGSRGAARAPRVLRRQPRAEPSLAHLLYLLSRLAVLGFGQFPRPAQEERACETPGRVGIPSHREGGARAGGGENHRAAGAAAGGGTEERICCWGRGCAGRDFSFLLIRGATRGRRRRRGEQNGWPGGCKYAQWGQRRRCGGGKRQGHACADTVQSQPHTTAGAAGLRGGRGGVGKVFHSAGAAGRYARVLRHGGHLGQRGVRVSIGFRAEQHSEGEHHLRQPLRRAAIPEDSRDVRSAAGHRRAACGARDRDRRAGHQPFWGAEGSPRPGPRSLLRRRHISARRPAVSR